MFTSVAVRLVPGTVMTGVVPSPPGVELLNTRYSVTPPPTLAGALQFSWICPALLNAVGFKGAVGAVGAEVDAVTMFEVPEALP